jgi:riboflavin kinase, archaea type
MEYRRFLRSRPADEKSANHVIEMKILRGKVESGIGDFGWWIEKLEAHYERKTGMKLYPGTLNIRLGEPYTVPAGCIRLEASEYGGSMSVNIMPCSILGRRAFILRTDSNESGEGRHPRTVVEIASDVKLRDEYHLVDGDEVSIEVED